ncbi:stage II sporulation protein P [Pelosinus sp. sgz500959]|uniref:stage II sporulation protein P n=1 Tax=Pelosinus sp. sgz500959 TaxID=3242472 RepID=UPI00366C8163
MLTRRVRHQAKKIKLVKKIVFSLIIFLFIYSVIWRYGGLSEEVLPVSANGSLQPEQYTVLQLPKWRDVLFSGIPRLIGSAGTTIVGMEKKENQTQQFLRDTMLFLTNIDIKDIRSLLQAEIPVLVGVKPVIQTVSAMNFPNFPKFEMVQNTPKDKPLVGLYYTHTAESFVPNTGATHRPGGQRGDIVNVGEALAKRLGTYDIAVVQDTTIHDYPSFMKAYGASEVTVKKMLAENPSLQMIFDIHRDAEKRENYIATVNGVQVARMMIVVTTGQQGLVQPHWQQNHAFAKLIDAKMNQRYPGVSRGIRMDDWRYNQHLHPRALLIEVGCQENTKEEAERGIELLGDIVAEIIAENKQ